MSGATVYGSRPIKRGRRTRLEMDRVRDQIRDLLAAENPMTARQVFYRLVAGGAIGKTEAEYKGTVVRLLGEMRLAGDIPFGWIADNTRWMRKPRTFDSAEDALRSTAETYRRSVWSSHDAYVEIWLEKDALAGVLLDVTEPWDVSLMVTRGYASLSFLHSAAETIEAAGKPAYIYLLSDFDPSGVDLARNVEKRLHEFAPAADLTFERIAVTREQIEEWQLPTRPTKTSDTRSKGFGAASVEVDAIPSASLRGLVEDKIAQHVDEHQMRWLELVEAEERDLLGRIADEMRS